jgi:diguanylate cyclase (GGDEF)-like protein
LLTDADHPPLQDTAEIARQTGFTQCVAALQRTLTTTPAGWALVAWISWGAVPVSQLAGWLGGFFGIWAASVWWLRRIARRGAQAHHDAPGVQAVAALDGAAWGASVGFLMGFDRVLDPWLAAILCGVSAVNAPVYITFAPAYRAQVAGLWIAAMLGALVSSGAHPVRLEGLAGLTIFLGLIVYYMNPIAQRVVEGIRLQLANAQLAQQLRDALALVEQDAATDPLTGLPNRRALDLVLARQLEVSGDPGMPLSVLLLDIDHFKRINDTHGHGIGDDVLRAFTRRVRGLLRENDLCARLGGEEFVVVLPDSTLQTALEMAERLRNGVAETPLLTAPLVPVTVSIGAAQYSRGQSATELLEAADQAVYAAKRRGRNQVQPQAGSPASGQRHSGPQAAVPGG